MKDGEIELLTVVTDRCRKGKISYHIRIPKYTVQRRVLKEKVKCLRADCDMITVRPLLAFSDVGIYRQNGSLRLSDFNCYYKPTAPQIHLITPEAYHKLLEQEHKSTRFDVKGAGLIDV